MGALKGNPSKKEGMKYLELPRDVEEIANAADRAKELADFIIEINGLLHYQTIETGKGKFENNFSKLDGKWSKTRPTATS